MQKQVPPKQTVPYIHDFLDMISPGTIKFDTDYYICGNTYRSCYA